MSETIIKVENVSKQYRLGQVGAGTITQDLNTWWHRMRGKDNPYRKIGEINDRTTKGTSEYVWALKDINFEVKKGDVLGIIGRNGAGKSTLLKILSQVTGPTSGEIKVRGRIASLLEVGTGFHPDLSGRENIFLNGAILGMTKPEIKKKLDEIIDFSGVERYIDTPVKRYSSGMYVRLAFAVAAHLDPEILIIDEVLAVGDAEFQKKCLGKMKDVSANYGRTILFVSHNISAIQSLCNKAILLTNGQLAEEGPVSKICSIYSGFDKFDSGVFLLGRMSSEDRVGIESVTLRNSDNVATGIFQTGDDITVEIVLNAHNREERPYVWLVIKANSGAIASACGMIDGYRTGFIPQGSCTVRCTFKKVPLLLGNYMIHMGVRDEIGSLGLSASMDVAQFAIVTLPSELGLNGTLADMIAPDIAPPSIPYTWEFNDGVSQTFEIQNYVK
jgi:lipopolysaccharide transport system ATP-binding protein